MDGENKGKPQKKLDDLGGKPTIFGNTQIVMVGVVFLRESRHWRSEWVFF